MAERLRCSGGGGGNSPAEDEGRKLDAESGIVEQLEDLRWGQQQQQQQQQQQHTCFS